MKAKIFFIILTGMISYGTTAQQLNRLPINRVMDQIFHFDRFFKKLHTRQVHNFSTRLDSINGWQYDSAAGTYNYSDKRIAYYDAQNNNTQYLSNTYNGSTFITQDMVEYIYDANNNLISETSYFYDGIGTYHLTPDYKTNYTYNSSNQITEIVYQNYDATTAGFINDNRDIFVYNSSSDTKPSSISDDVWDSSTNDWQPNERFEITYNASGQFTTVLIRAYNSGAFVDDGRVTRTYDSNNRLTLELWERMNSTTGQWENSGKREVSINQNGNVLEVVKQDYIWDGSWQLLEKQVIHQDITNGNILLTEDFEWNDTTGLLDGNEKITYSYSGNTIESFSYYWDYSSADWQSDAYKKTVYTYDMNVLHADILLPVMYHNDIYDTIVIDGLPSQYNDFHHKLIEKIVYSRPSPSDPWEESFKYDYFYTDITNGISKEDSLTTKVYPVPFDDYIQFKVEGNSDFQLQLMDMNGRVLYTAKHQNNERVDVSGLSKGVYMYKITTAQGQAAGQIIKK